MDAWSNSADRGSNGCCSSRYNRKTTLLGILVVLDELGYSHDSASAPDDRSQTSD
jgi:hypothetical protein